MVKSDLRGSLEPYKVMRTFSVKRVFWKAGLPTFWVVLSYPVQSVHRASWSVNGTLFPAFSLNKAISSRTCSFGATDDSLSGTGLEQRS